MLFQPSFLLNTLPAETETINALVAVWLVDGALCVSRDVTLHRLSVLIRLVDNSPLDSRLHLNASHAKECLTHHSCIEQEPVTVGCLCQCCTHNSSFLLSFYFAHFSFFLFSFFLFSLLSFLLISFILSFLHSFTQCHSTHGVQQRVARVARECTTRLRAALSQNRSGSASVSSGRLCPPRLATLLDEHRRHYAVCGCCDGRLSVLRGAGLGLGFFRLVVLWMLQGW